MFRILFVLLVWMFFFQDVQCQSILNDATIWREIGPYRGGRSCAVTGVPGKPNLFYFGATGGGVWKTTDGGRSWENISDGYFGGSIGAIAVASSDQNVIYVGGGEKTVRGNVSSGYGMFKSVDGGKSWQPIGLEASRHISRIRVHPENPDILWVAVLGNLYKDHNERGVFKSMDGGKTWKKVLFANNRSGAVDLVIDPNNPRILFASTWTVRRNEYSLSSGGEGSGLWKSSDAGETWENISAAEGLPEGTWGISGVSVSPVNSDRVFAIIENEKGGVFRSDDGGKSWKKTNEDRALRQRAWYYTRIYADSKDEDVVYVMNVSYHRSKDGGKTFSPSRAPHGDHHDLWIAPENPNRMIIGDDGGAQITYDGGETWSTYHNQATAQFYRVTTDDHFPYRIYAAQQDNSTIRILHRTDGYTISEKHWESTAGGESAHIAVDPENNDIVYGGSYGGFLTRLDHNTGFNRAINVWPDNPMGYGAEGMKYRFQWNFPVFFSQHDSDKLYTCSNHVHLSTDEGQSWEVISPDLTRNDPEKLKASGGPITKDNTGVEYYCTLFAAQESPLKEGLIWVGSDDGLIHYTDDGGKNWNNVTPNSIPKWLMINCIEPDPFDEATCYVAGTAYKAGDFAPYLLKTNNFGKTWQSINNGIDKEHFTRAIRADRTTEDVLYCGTETGAYVSYNGGQEWHSMQANLPIVPITDMTIKNDDLIISTQGRGIWMIDDLQIVREAASLNFATKPHLFEIGEAYRMKGQQAKETKGAGTNHPGGVNSSFYLSSFNEESDSISIHYLNEKGDTIRSYSSYAEKKEDKIKVEPGINRHTWDLREAPARSFEGMVLWWGSMNGPMVLPGKYRALLNVNGETQEQAFEVLADPRVGYSDEDQKAQYAFIKDINTTVTEAHSCIEDIRDLRDQMNLFKDRYDSEKISTRVSSIDSTMKIIEESLYQTKNRSRQDPLNYPIRLTNKLAHLNSLIQISEGPPTQQMIEVKDELTNEIRRNLDAFEKIKKEELPALNALIKDEVSEFIKLKK